MPPKTLMFINKTSDSKSLSRSTGQEKQRIFSHVQHVAADDITDATIKIHKWWAIDETESNNAETLTFRPRMPPPHEPKCRSKAGKPRQTRTKKAELTGDSSVVPNTVVVRQPVPARPPSIPPTLQFDPEAYVDAHGVSQHYMGRVMGFCGGPPVMTWEYANQTLYLVSNLFAQKLFPSKFTAQTMLTHTLSVAAESPVARNALLSAVASTMTIISAGDACHDQHALYFKGIALHRLRKHIGEDMIHKAPGAALYTISMLLWSECVKGDVEHVAAHIAGLQQILACVDISKHMPPSQLAGIYGTSNLCSLMLRAPPLPPPQLIRIFGISKKVDLCVQSQLDGSCPQSRLGFFEPSVAALLGPRLVRLAARARARHMLVLGERTLEKCVADHPNNHGMAYEGMSIDYELLALAHGDGVAQLTPVQRVFVLSLYLVSQPMMAQLGPTSALARSVCKQVHEAIDGSDVSALWEPHRELLLWVLFIAAYYTEIGARWNWLVEQIRRLFEVLEISSKAQFLEILQRYLLVDDLFDDTLERVWLATGRDWMLGSELVEDLD